MMSRSEVGAPERECDGGEDDATTLGLIWAQVAQTTAHENATTFWVFSSSVHLDHFPAQSFVGFDRSLRQGRYYAGLRSFFLVAKARSKLRR